jgi:hypothetical protein
VDPRQRPIDGLLVGVAKQPIGDGRERGLDVRARAVVHHDDDLVRHAPEQAEHRGDAIRRSPSHAIHRERHRTFLANSETPE